MTNNVITFRRFGLFRVCYSVYAKQQYFEAMRSGAYSYVIGIDQKRYESTPDIHIRHKKTLHVMLDRTPEELLANFHDTTRNEVRRTFCMTELEYSATRPSGSEWRKLYTVFRRQKGLRIYPVQFFEGVLFFTARYRGKLVAIITCYDAYPYLRIQNIFTDLTQNRELRKITGYATRRLVYEICVFGSKGGYRLLDLASVNFADSRKSGITRFKQSFGGIPADEYTHVWKSPPLVALTQIKHWARYL